MPFDPDNPTFYGESLPVEIGRDVTGTAIATKYTGTRGEGVAVTYLYDDQATQTADAGDSILFGVYPDWTYLQADDEAEFTVVVELAAGSSGTFRLSAGVDPDWNLTSETLCTEVLGTFTASGPGRVLAPIHEAYTVPIILNGHDFEPLLFLEVLTGTVVIRQIRVRMWPPGGASGAWVDAAPFTKEYSPTFMKSGGVLAVDDATETPQALGTGGPQAYLLGPGLWGGFDDYGDTVAAFSEMTHALSGEPIPTYQAFDDSTSDFYDHSATGKFGYYWTLKSLGSPGHDWSGGYNFGLAILAFRPIRQVYVDGQLSFYDPDRIKWEDSAAVRDGVTGGTLLSDFGGWTVLPEITAGTGNAAYIGARAFALGTEPPWDEQSSGFGGGAFNWAYFYADGVPRGAVTAPGPEAGTFPIPDSPVVGIEVAPLFIQDPPDNYDGLTFDSAIGSGSYALGDRTVGYGSTKALHLYDNVQYFDPSLTPVPERPDPRFFVRTLSLRWAPVGFGKPPEETTVFHVQTPEGLYRDLTTAEYDALREP